MAVLKQYKTNQNSSNYHQISVNPIKNINKFIHSLHRLLPFAQKNVCSLGNIELLHHDISDEYHLQSLHRTSSLLISAFAFHGFSVLPNSSGTSMMISFIPTSPPFSIGAEIIKISYPTIQFAFSSHTYDRNYHFYLPDRYNFHNTMCLHTHMELQEPVYGSMHL